MYIKNKIKEIKTQLNNALNELNRLDGYIQINNELINNQIKKIMIPQRQITNLKEIYLILSF